MTTTAQIISATIGRKRIITRAEMEGLLLALHAGGLDMTNSYVYESQQSPERAAATWAKAVKGITLISASMGGVGLGHADGWVRYDQPGSMHPAQRSEVMFVSADYADDLYYLRRHTARLLRVRYEEDPPPPVDPDAGKLRSQCDDGHTWMAFPGDEKGERCPRCGGWSV